MRAQNEDEKQTRRLATWMRRLADPSDVVAVASASYEVEIASLPDDVAESDEHLTHEERDDRALQLYRLAAASLAEELDELIPKWTAHFIDHLHAAQRFQERWLAAMKLHPDELPEFDTAGIVAVGQLKKALQAVGERLDAHCKPVIAALGTMDKDRDEYLAAVLEYVGPTAAASAAPKLMNALRAYGVWCWPSHVARALARSAQADDAAFATLRRMLSHEGADQRKAAVDVLGLMGPAARAATDELLAFQSGDEGEQCGMIHSLARQGDPTPAFLDVLEAAMRSDNGYVRCSAVYALAELTPQPDRFVPLLIEVCDWTEPLHDNDLPEDAVEALGRYGPAAKLALPRLRRFIEGPIKGRTVNAERVRRALERITANDPTAAEKPKSVSIRSAPIPDDEPLFAVTHEGKQSYIDRQGRIALATRFASGGAFSDGRAVMRDEEGGTFVIDRQGREVFHGEWEDIKLFSEGLAAVKRHKKWGFVDTEGRVVVESMYDAVTSFSEGLAGFEIGRGVESMGDGLTRTVLGPQGYVDRSGAVVIPARWRQAQKFHNGRALVCTDWTVKPNLIFDGRKMESDHKFGFIDRSSNVVIPGRYDFAQSFNEGLALVQIGDLVRRARYGYIDAAGCEVIPLTLIEAHAFQDGLALVKRRGKKRRGVYFVIDREGRTVAELRHPVVRSLSEGLALASNGDCFGFVDLAGHWVIEPQFDQCNPFIHGLAEVQRGDWYGLIDRTGRFIWGPTTEGGVFDEAVLDWTW